MLAEWNQMKKFYRGSYIDASCQIWLHLAQQFFLTLTNQKQELSLAAIFVGGMGRNELYRGPYIDAFCQVWFQLFQRSRLKYEKLTDERQTPSDGNTSHDPLGQVS